MTRVSALVTALLVGLLVGLLAGCSSDGSTGRAGPEPSPSIRTLTALPMAPTPPATGELVADMRQSSRDVALGRMQVWIGNDTLRGVTPTRITYTDGRFRTTLTGERLRLNPPRSERGYPLTLPGLPACGSTDRHGTVAVTYGDRTVTVDVEDSTDVVGRYTSERCLELAVAKVADVRWDDDIAVDRPGEGSTATFVLDVRPTGVPGHELVIDSVGGTPVFSAAGETSWAPDVRISSTGAPQRIELPAQPARCDEHVFLESAGATAFLVQLHLDGKPGRLLIRMSPTGTLAAIDYAREACGL